MLSDGTNDYEYDNEGNLIRKTNTVTGEVTEYTWDYRNRLTAVVHKDGQGNVLWTETYVYDAFNRRIAFYEDPDGPTGPEPERFTFVLHDLAQPPTAEQVAQGGLAPYVDGIYSSEIFAANPLADFTDPDTSDGINPQLTERRLYAAAIDSLLAREDTLGEITFDLTDYLGSVRGWVDSTGTILATLTYDSYGNPLGPDPQAAGSRFGYTARSWSALRRAYAMRARWLDPSRGQFTSPDPIGFLSGRAAPSYAGNSPVYRRDPTGLIEIGNPEDKKAWGVETGDGRSLKEVLLDAEKATLSAIKELLARKDISLAEREVLLHIQRVLPTLRVYANAGRRSEYQAHPRPDEERAIDIYPANMYSVYRHDGTVPSDGNELLLDSAEGRNPKFVRWGVAELAGLLCNEALHVGDRWQAEFGSSKYEVTLPVGVPDDKNAPRAGEDIANLPTACALHNGDKCQEQPLRFADHIFCVVTRMVKEWQRPGGTNRTR